MSFLPLALPSPSQGVWYLGPFPIRAYAVAILIGIVVAAYIGVKRYEKRGGDAGVIVDVCFWAVPFGIVGARIYHVITTPEPYFGAGGNPVRALYIWEGGLGIWGAIALGAVGAYIGARRAGAKFPPIADSLAPGILAAQAIGRLGNYFNQELFGKPTTLPWGLEVSDANTRAAGYPPGTLFQPTFLYELIWNLVGVIVLVWADRRFKLGHGRVFWLYVTIYTAGRTWIEMLRIDTAEHFFGIRLNVFTSLVMFVIALAAFIVTGRLHPGRESDVMRRTAAVAAGAAAPDSSQAGSQSAGQGGSDADRGSAGDEGEDSAGDVGQTGTGAASRPT